MSRSISKPQRTSGTEVLVRRSEIRRLVAEYVHRRLQDECQVRGRAAEIATVTGFSPAHVSNAKAGSRGVGEDFAAALGQFWGMEYQQLEQTALAWAEEHGVQPEVRREAPRFRQRAEWAAALEEARRLYRAIPEEFFKQAGDFYDHLPHPVDAQFVGDLARSLWDVALRDPASQRAPRDVTGTTAPPRSSGKKGKSG